MKHTTSFKIHLMAFTALMSLSFCAQGAQGIYEKMLDITNDMEKQSDNQDLSKGYSGKLTNNFSQLKNDLKRAIPLARNLGGSSINGTSLLIEVATVATETEAIHSFSAEAQQNIEDELSEAINNLTDQDEIDDANAVLDALESGPVPVRKKANIGTSTKRKKSMGRQQENTRQSRKDRRRNRGRDVDTSRSSKKSTNGSADARLAALQSGRSLSAASRPILSTTSSSTALVTAPAKKTSFLGGIFGGSKKTAAPVATSEAIVISGKNPPPIVATTSGPSVSLRDQSVASKRLMLEDKKAEEPDTSGTNTVFSGGNDVADDVSNAARKAEHRAKQEAMRAAKTGKGASSTTTPEASSGGPLLLEDIKRGAEATESATLDEDNKAKVARLKAEHKAKIAAKKTEESTSTAMVVYKGA